jgi:drug/metabolite transporter (DMT)-like permease
VPRDSLDPVRPLMPEPVVVSKPQPIVMGLTDYGIIALQSMLWGSTFFFISIARKDVPPLTLSMIRLVPAVLFLFTIVTLMGLRLPATWFEWRRFFIFSLLNNVIPFWLIIQAQREVTGGIAGIFMAVGPLWALLLAPLFIAEERFTWQRLVGILVGIMGVAILTGAGGSAGSWRAQGMLLTAAFLFSCANIYARKFLGGHPPFIIASAQTIGSLIISTPLALLMEQSWSLPTPGRDAWLAMLVMGIVGSGLAPLCHFTVLKRVGPVNAMLSSIIVPITPVVLGSLFLGEHLRPRELAGGAVIAIALLIIDGRVFRWLQKKVRVHL